MIGKTIKVAITGTAGSGKTFVCNHLEKLGATIISSDAIAKEIVAPNLPAYKNIVVYFGKEIVKSDGTLNRRMLRSIIINNDSARRKLELFTHPEIIKIIFMRINEAEKSNVAIVGVEIPLLFKLGMENQFDEVVQVVANHNLKIERLMCRDNISHSEATTLLNIQTSIGRADFIIKNNRSITQMETSVEKFYTKLIKKYKKTIDNLKTI